MHWIKSSFVEHCCAYSNSLRIKENLLSILLNNRPLRIKSNGDRLAFPAISLRWRSNRTYTYKRATAHRFVCIVRSPITWFLLSFCCLSHETTSEEFPFSSSGIYRILPVLTIGYCLIARNSISVWIRWVIPEIQWLLSGPWNHTDIKMGVFYFQQTILSVIRRSQVDSAKSHRRTNTSNWIYVA